MRRSIGPWQFVGFAFVSLVGTLLHFLYDWLGGASWSAIFSGVNESTWEHMKLLFFPMALYALFERFFFWDRDDFWCVKLRGTLLGLSLIPILFYTYNGAIGKSPDWLNISIFFISAAIAYIYETRLFNRGTLSCKTSRWATLLLFLIAILFAVFTFKTPSIGIFRDPLTGEFGI